MAKAKVKEDPLSEFAKPTQEEQDAQDMRDAFPDGIRIPTGINPTPDDIATLIRLRLEQYRKTKKAREEKGLK